MFWLHCSCINTVELGVNTGKAHIRTNACGNGYGKLFVLYGTIDHLISPSHLDYYIEEDCMYVHV